MDLSALGLHLARGDDDALDGHHLKRKRTGTKRVGTLGLESVRLRHIRSICSSYRK